MILRSYPLCIYYPSRLNNETGAGPNNLGGRKRTGLAELDVAFRSAWALDIDHGKVLVRSVILELTGFTERCVCPLPPAKS